MNWKKFKEQMEITGVKDEDELWYIDIAFDGELVISKDSEMGWAVYS